MSKLALNELFKCQPHKNGQRHSNNSPANFLSVFGHFVELALKKLISSIQRCIQNPVKHFTIIVNG